MADNKCGEPKSVETLVIKLWKTLVANGVGGQLTPCLGSGTDQCSLATRAVVRANERKMLAQSEMDLSRHQSSNDEINRAKYSSTKRWVQLAKNNNITDQIRRDINVSKAILHAEEVLCSFSRVLEQQGSPVHLVSATPVNVDWLLRWRDYVGRVSETELQILWGKLLAAEVKSPGSHSLRTLNLMSMLSKEESQQIEKLAGFVLEGAVVISGPLSASQESQLGQYLTQRGLTYSFFLTLNELGLLSGVEVITGLSVKHQVNGKRLLFASNKALLVATKDSSPSELELQCYAITTIGKQLLQLGEFEPDMDYLRLVGAEIAKQQFTVHIASYVDHGNGYEYFPEERVDA